MAGRGQRVSTIRSVGHAAACASSSTAGAGYGNLALVYRQHHTNLPGESCVAHGAGGRACRHSAQHQRPLSEDRPRRAAVSAARCLLMAYPPGLDEDERVAVDDGDDLGALTDQGGHALQGVTGQRAAGAAAGHGDREGSDALVVCGVPEACLACELQRWVRVKP
jgi:hypothetical protein